MAQQDHVEFGPGRLGGKPVVRGTRIPAALVVDVTAAGWPDARILDECPTLTPDAMRTCLRYAADLLPEERRFPLPAA
jgi:uncharacterized protein (DUF433 family)